MDAQMIMYEIIMAKMKNMDKDITALYKNQLSVRKAIKWICFAGICNSISIIMLSRKIDAEYAKTKAEIAEIRKQLEETEDNVTDTIE